MNKTHLLYGISKGLGKALSLHLREASDLIVGVS
jgi:hypothetical protein